MENSHRSCIFHSLSLFFLSHSLTLALFFFFLPPSFLPLNHFHSAYIECFSMLLIRFIHLLSNRFSREKRHGQRIKWKIHITQRNEMERAIANCWEKNPREWAIERERERVWTVFSLWINWKTHKCRFCMKKRKKNTLDSIFFSSCVCLIVCLHELQTIISAWMRAFGKRKNMKRNFVTISMSHRT